MRAGYAFPPNMRTLSFHLTLARLQLAINCTTLAAALAPFPRGSYRSALLWFAAAALWALRFAVFNRRSPGQDKSKARVNGSQDEEGKVDMLGGKAEAGWVGEEGKAERAGLPAAGEAIAGETVVSVAGLVVGMAVFGVGVRNVYAVWRDC